MMRRLGIAVVTAVTVAAALTPTGVAQQVGGRRHRVIIQGLRFTPADVVAAPGDTVLWVNRDLVPHTITAQDESWGSDGLATNITWEMRVTDSTAGDYFCRYHPTMHGRLLIRRR
jgi:plastocyanin